MPLPLPMATLTAATTSSSSSSSAAFLRLPPPHRTRARVRASSSPAAPDELAAPLMPNAWRREHDPLYRRLGGGGGGFSLGVDLGAARTGLAVGKGFTRPRPLTVLRLRGQKLELRLLEIAQQEEADEFTVGCLYDDILNRWLLDKKKEADEFIVGLPVSSDGNETAQSNKVRSIVGRLAVQAAERGLRVYLQDEYGTSLDALRFMISEGTTRSARDVTSDAYSAMMILERYFSSAGHRADIVLPKQPGLQEKLRSRSTRGPEDCEGVFY